MALQIEAKNKAEIYIFSCNIASCGSAAAAMQCEFVQIRLSRSFAMQMSWRCSPRGCARLLDLQRISGVQCIGACLRVAWIAFGCSYIVLGCAAVDDDDFSAPARGIREAEAPSIDYSLAAAQSYSCALLLQRANNSLELPQKRKRLDERLAAVAEANVR